jgi:hypothetical protein
MRGDARFRMVLTMRANKSSAPIIPIRSREERGDKQSALVDRGSLLVCSGSNMGPHADKCCKSRNRRRVVMPAEPTFFREAAV